MGTSYTIRPDCRLCSSDMLRGMLTLEPTPLANEFLKPEETNEELFPLYLVECLACGHIQLPVVVDPERLFRNYVYVSGTSPTFVEHFRRYANDLCQARSLTKKDLVVEIGSNDGTLLKAFRQNGVRVLGIDPALEIAAKATSEGITTIPHFFRESIAEEIVRDFGHASLVVANNVFAHADDLAAIVRGVKTLLAPDGAFVFEVQYLGDLLDGGLFDMCLPPEDPILTRDGWKPIGDVVAGDEVLTHLGRFKKVTRVSRRPFKGDLCVVQPYGADIPIRTTPEHPLYVRRGLGEFVEAQQITRKDVALKPAILERKKLPWLSITTKDPGKRGVSTKKFRLDKNLARVIGYYLAEGFTTLGKSVGKDCAVATFAFGKSTREKKLAQDCVRRIHRIGGSAKATLSKFGWRVNTYGPLARLLHRECGTGSDTKKIPPWAYTIGDDLTEEILFGYALGDGYSYRKKRYWRISTVSIDLARGAALLANKLGWACSINKSKWKRLLFPAMVCGGPTLVSQPLIDILIRHVPEKRLKVWCEANYQHGTIRSTAKQEYDGDVCNVEVEDDHSYVTPAGAVHNCYHEHLSYHAVKPLVAFFRRLGMTLYDVKRVDTHGGSIRCRAYVGEHESLDNVRGFVDAEQNIAERFDGLRRSMQHNGATLRATLLRARSRGQTIAGYGAPAKATTLVREFRISGLLDFVVDDSPWKQGLCMPGSRVPVYDGSMASNCDVLVVFAWNFAEPILKKLRAAGFFDGKRRAIVPLPAYMEISE